MIDRALLCSAALAVVIAALGGLGAGCSDEPCQQAAESLERCLERLDCRDVDPTDKRKCDTAVTEGTSAVDDLRSLPCVAQLKDKAGELNSCPLDQVPFCNCFVL